jgi:hypothetical protein
MIEIRRLLGSRGVSGDLSRVSAYPRTASTWAVFIPEPTITRRDAFARSAESSQLV